MSKRFMLPQQYGYHKKPRLNIPFSDHNFPLSRNSSANKQDGQGDVWGDDNVDAMLLLASQECDDGTSYISNDINTLPDYSICMQPTSMSTQLIDQPQPSTSRTDNNVFKKPTMNPLNAVSSTELKNKCNTIFSPLYGITNKIVSKNDEANFIDDLIVNDKIYEQDSGQMHKQLLQLHKENAKLKSDNSILLEKCVTKDGEVSILRTQLKTCQISVDNARLKQVNAQEKAQIEFNEKLNAVKNEINDLRNQLDFKNLEIISVKERCRMMESSKVKLTQVTVSGNDTSFRRNSTTSVPINFQQPSKRTKLITTSAQTENRSPFIRLNQRNYTVDQRLNEILPIILQDATEQQNSMLDYNEKLLKPHDFSQTKCRIFSTFHRITSTPTPRKENEKEKLSLQSLHSSLSLIASTRGEFSEIVEKQYVNVFRQVKKILSDVLVQLNNISQRITAGFQREMDEKYMDASAVFLDIRNEELLLGKPMYKEEQGVLARRVMAVLARTINSLNSANCFYKWDTKLKLESKEADDIFKGSSIDLLNRICSQLDSTSCAVLYSGFLMSVTLIIEIIWTYVKTQELYKRFIDMLKIIITSRTMPAVVCQVLSLMRILSIHEDISVHICSSNVSGNLSLDYNQGVLLYKRETCILQIFLKQLECALKAIERENLIGQIIGTTQNLLEFYSNINTHSPIWVQDNQRRCNCGVVLAQIVVYSLYICANVLRNLSSTHDARIPLEAICRRGLVILYQWVLRDVEFTSKLGFNEGHSHIFIEICEQLKEKIILDSVQGNLLTELVGTLQQRYENVNSAPTLCQKVWIDSFSTFTITD